MRDNFSKSVINNARLRVANRCSNPDCRVSTSAAATNNKLNNIGVAAHLSAASPGGPRFLKKMSRKERVSIDNAIWLCANCAAEIDRDAEKFTIDLLKQWRNTAERLANQELGKKLPDSNDAINTTVAALTGFQKKFLATAISNVHSASEISLTKLDPRFCVKSSYVNNQTRFEIFAKETVEASLLIQGSSAKDLQEKYSRFLEYGDDIEIESSQLTFAGSKLLEEITKEAGKLIISKNKKKAIQKLWLVNKMNSEIDIFDDIVGEVKPGRSQFEFKGYACNGTFSFTCKFDSNGNRADVAFGISYDKWRDLDLRNLPFLSKIYSFFEKIGEGWEIFIALEIDGNRLLTSKGINVSQWDYIKETRYVLMYIKYVSEIASYFDELILFKTDFSFTENEFNKTAQVAKIARGESIYAEKDLNENVISEFAVAEYEGLLAHVKDFSKPLDFEVRDNSNDSIRMFNKVINLPDRIISVKHAIANIIDENQGKRRDLVKIEWMPASGFECKVKYLKI